MRHIYAVEQATGLFVYGGSEPYDCVPGLSPGQIRLELPRVPDRRAERYTGNPDSPFRAATAQEIAAYDAAQKDEQAQREYRVDLMALAAALYKASTGKFPTAAQAAQIKADFVTARKALS